MVQNFKPMILRTVLRTVQFDESLADSAGPRETLDGAYRQREAFSPLDRTDNVEVHHAFHRRVLSALTFTPSFRCERPRTGHRPRTRARDAMPPPSLVHCAHRVIVHAIRDDQFQL